MDYNGMVMCYDSIIDYYVSGKSQELRSKSSPVLRKLVDLGTKTKKIEVLPLSQ